jgi:hypothetical protein
MVDEFIAFKSNIYTVMNEVCDIVINYVETNNETSRGGDHVKKFEEKTKSIKKSFKFITNTSHNIMNLDPEVVAFESRSSLNDKSINKDRKEIEAILGDADLDLFSSIVNEWHNSPMLNHCLSLWKKPARNDGGTTSLTFHVLCFNVRGLDYR